jgi:hypothetical protein
VLLKDVPQLLGLFSGKRVGMKEGKWMDNAHSLTIAFAFRILHWYIYTQLNSSLCM